MISSLHASLPRWWCACINCFSPKSWHHVCPLWRLQSNWETLWQTRRVPTDSGHSPIGTQAAPYRAQSALLLVRGEAINQRHRSAMTSSQNNAHSANIVTHIFEYLYCIWFLSAVHANINCTVGKHDFYIHFNNFAFLYCTFTCTCEDPALFIACLWQQDTVWCSSHVKISLAGNENVASLCSLFCSHLSR